MSNGCPAKRAKAQVHGITRKWKIRMIVGASQERSAVAVRSFLIWGEELSKKRRHAAAERLYQRARSLVERTLGQYHPMMAEVLECYSELLVKTDRQGEGIAMKRRSEAIWEAYAPRTLSIAPSVRPCRSCGAEGEGSD